jgi:uncharacterized protein YceK
MNQSSSVNTLAATAGMTGVAASVQWLANSKMGWGMPPEVVLFVSAGLISAGHFLVNLLNAVLAKDGLPTVSETGTVVTRESGFARLPVMLALVAVAGLCLALSGCGAVNGWVAGRTTIVEQDAAGYVKNQQKVDDDYLSALQLGACDVKVGALRRNVAAMPFVMEGCPIPNTAQVTVNNGAVSLKVPSSVPLTQPASATASTATAAPAASLSQTQLDQLSTSIAQALKAQSVNPASVAPAPVQKASQKASVPRLALPATPAPIAAPGSSGATGGAVPAPSKAVPTQAPVIPAAPAPPVAAEQSFLSAPVVPK